MAFEKSKNDVEDQMRRELKKKVAILENATHHAIEKAQEKEKKIRAEIAEKRLKKQEAVKQKKDKNNKVLPFHLL